MSAERDYSVSALVLHTLKTPSAGGGIFRSDERSPGRAAGIFNHLNTAAVHTSALPPSIWEPFMNTQAKSGADPNNRQAEAYTAKDKTHSNTVYALLSRIQPHDPLGRRPCLFSQARKMAEALAASEESDGKLREKVRKLLPCDLSPALIKDAQSAIDDYGQMLREELYEIFTTELDRALGSDQKKSL